MTLDYLEWDSVFFSKKTGRIFFDIQDLNNLSLILKEAGRQAYELIYLFTPESIFLNDDIIKSFNGKLIDRRVVYRLYFQKISNQPSFVEEYLYPELTDDLKNLAYLSGSYSRFFLDDNFTPDEFCRLYYTWIIKSVKKELAENIFIVKNNGKIVGMVTLRQQNSVGEIGLIAVSDSVRGQGYGSMLIEACKKSLSEKNINILDVRTQIANKGACIFYEKCGFIKLSVTNIYHFWF